MSVATDVRVLKVYKEFKAKMKRYGKTVSFPQDTDPRETYNWRFVSNFMRKLDKEGFTDEMMPIAVEAVVDHAYNNGVIDKGFAILNHGDVLVICKKKLERDEQKENNELSSIKASVAFVMEQCNGKNWVETMLWRSTHRSYANITRWYETGKLNKGYISVSRACRRAISKLDGQERLIFPSLRNLMHLRILLVSSPIVVQLREILGKDLFEE